VFAAGDVRSGSIKRVASAVGEGSMTVQFVHERLTEARKSEAGPRPAPLGADGDGEPCAAHRLPREEAAQSR
jgi:thioredoxin reductase (NADPH)